MAETLHITPGPSEFVSVLFLLGVLGWTTWLAYRHWGVSQALIALVALDLYLGVVELPSRLFERAVVVGQERLSLRVGRWYDPVNIDLPLDQVVIVYEVERSRGWLAAETFWLFQDNKFRRQRLFLPPLFKRRRQVIARFLETQGIAFQVHQSAHFGDVRVLTNP